MPWARWNCSWRSLLRLLNLFFTLQLRSFFVTSMVYSWKLSDLLVHFYTWTGDDTCQETAHGSGATSLMLLSLLGSYRFGPGVPPIIPFQGFRTSCPGAENDGMLAISCNTFFLFYGWNIANPVGCHPKRKVWSCKWLRRIGVLTTDKYQQRQHTFYAFPSSKEV